MMRLFTFFIICVCFGCSKNVPNEQQGLLKKEQEMLTQLQKKENEPSQKEIEKRWSQFIGYWETEDANGCASMYSSNGINIAPESNIRKGREEIEDFYNLLFNNNLKSDYTHQIQAIESFGNQAFERGQFQVNWMRNDSTSWTFKARSMTHWKKNESGQWEIEQFLFNKDVPDN